MSRGGPGPGRCFHRVTGSRRETLQRVGAGRLVRRLSPSPGACAGLGREGQGGGTARRCAEPTSPQVRQLAACCPALHTCSLTFPEREREAGALHRTRASSQDKSDACCPLFMVVTGRNKGLLTAFTWARSQALAPLFASTFPESVPASSLGTGFPPTPRDQVTFPSKGEMLSALTAQHPPGTVPSPD